MGTKHTVAQGESLASIARKHGFLRWETLYQHPDNAELRKKRPNPNVLYPGDQVVIPDKAQKPKTAAVAHEKVVSFKVKKSVSWVRIQAKGFDGKPLAKKLYALVVGGATFQGTTTATGMVEQKVPTGAQEGKLTVWLTRGKRTGAHHTWTLRIGHLDPHDEVEGVQARLNNLGYPCGAVDGDVGPWTKAALERFQSATGLKVTGEIDAATTKKLRDEHGNT